jgi:hypothetical protein
LTKFKQPPRLPDDGPCGVTRVDDDHLRLSAVSCGVEGSIIVSRYNASRLYAMIGMFLEIPLSKAVGKEIILSPPDKKMDVSFGFPEQKTLGERMAQALVVSQMPDRIGDFVKVK